MAVTVTGLQVLQQIVERGGLGKYIDNSEIGALAVGSLTSVLHFRNGHHSTNHWRSKSAGLYRPSQATGVADYWRTAGDLTPSTGVLAVDANWADSSLGTEDVILLEKGVLPIHIRDAMNRGLGKVYFSNSEPLSTKPTGTVVADAGFQSSATTSYVESDADGGPATTFTKVTTANSENVWPGMIASGRVVNTAAGGYIRQRFAVTEGEQVVVFALTRLDSGTNVQLILWDVENAEAIGTTVEHDEEQWQWMRRSESIPTGCKTLEVRVAGEGASDDFYINALCVYRTRDRRIILDTKWENEFEVPALGYMHIRGVSPGNNSVYSAFASDFTTIPHNAYQFEAARAGANPFALQLNESEDWFQYPIWILGRRAHSDVEGPFTLAMSELTSADLDLLVWASLVELFENPQILAKVPDAGTTLTKAKDELGKTQVQFKHAPAAKERETVVMRGAGN